MRNDIDDGIKLMSANQDGTATYRATIESADGKTIWIHTGDRQDCRRWVKNMLGEVIYTQAVAGELLKKHLDSLGR